MGLNGKISCKEKMKNVTAEPIKPPRIQTAIVFSHVNLIESEWYEK